MDLAKRQALQQALEQAIANHTLIAIECADGQRHIVRCDLTCYENHIEATDKDGLTLTIPYADVETVSAAGPSGEKS
jgi:hypothetical protein